MDETQPNDGVPTNDQHLDPSESPSELIDSVPGVTSQPPAPTPKMGEVTSMTEDEFIAAGGDPSKVLGHPTNPSPAIAQAAANSLLGRDGPTTTNVDQISPDSPTQPDEDHSSQK